MEIPGYPNYIIYRDGRVWSKITKKYIKQQEDYLGYLYLGLQNEGRKFIRKVHRLVAITFLPNPNGYPIIHHINGVRNDNRVENLEWCTIEYNNQSINTKRNFGSICRDGNQYRYHLFEYGHYYNMGFKTFEEAELYRDITKLFYVGLVINN